MFCSTFEKGSISWSNLPCQDSEKIYSYLPSQYGVITLFSVLKLHEVITMGCAVDDNYGVIFLFNTEIDYL